MTSTERAMNCSEDNAGTAVQEFYRDSVVLITGGTGFLGKVLVEKLLRSCPHVSQIILLIRSKKEDNCQQRLDRMMEGTLLKGVSLKDRLKIFAVQGDCSLPQLGLSEKDELSLQTSVNVIFHAAASVRFDDDLKSAVTTNIVGTKAILDLAKKMPKLKAFVHVSTAYSQCHLDSIEEKFYTPKYSPEKLIKLTECVDKPYLDRLTPLLMEDFPNTYVYTKSIAEELIRNCSKNFPVALFRPSIVVGTHGGPLPGWVDSFSGMTRVLVGIMTGTIRIMHCDPSSVVDIVPADMVVNAMIVTAWRTNVRSRSTKMINDHPQVFNFVSSPENPTTWGELSLLLKKVMVPSANAVWYPNIQISRHKIVFQILHWLFQWLPAFLCDNALNAVGKQANLMKITKNVETFSKLTSYFSTRQWNFSNSNTQEMWRTLSAQDKELFPFSFENLDWDSYFQNYMWGTRQYMLKEDSSTAPRAMARAKRFYWIYQIMKAVTFFYLMKYMWNAAGARYKRMLFI